MLVGEEGGDLAAAEHRKAARLVEIGGELGEKLVVAQPDRHGDAELGFDAEGEPREELGGVGGVELLGAAEIEECLVNRQRLDERRQPQHLGAHRTPDLAIFRHVGPDHHPIRASRQRLEHRHRRAYAIEPSHIATGEHNTAGAASDHDRSIGEVRPVAFLDRGVKGVAIDVGDRQCVKRGMMDLARRAARATPPARGGRDCKGAAIAARCRHPSSSGRHSQAAPRTPLESP